MESLQQHPTYRQALEVIRRIKEAKHVVYFAGGCVRDGILGRSPQDLDLATDATPDEIQLLFPEALGIGKAFGIMMLPLGPHQKLEIATFREDGEYRDGRRPEAVKFSTAEEDAKRRDFTINALFFDPESQKVIDFVHGQMDLGKRIIRTVGDPKTRFQEDQLRLLRAVRFSSQLDFEIEKETLREIKQLAPFVTKVAQERILEELQKLLRGTFLLKGLTALLETRLWAELYKGWFSKDMLEWNADQTFEALDLIGEMSEARSRMYWLLRKSGAEIKRGDLQRLKLSNAWSDAFAMWSGVEILIESSSKKLLTELVPETWIQTLEWYRTDLNADFRVWLDRQKFLLPFALEILKRFEGFDRLPEKFDEPVVKSQDLMATGILPGPQMGKALKRALEIQLRLSLENQKVPSREDVLSHLETRS